MRIMTRVVSVETEHHCHVTRMTSSCVACITDSSFVRKKNSEKFLKKMINSNEVVKHNQTE